jgi:hypothetical protein
LWQTPVRQDQRTGTSQDSANSSRLMLGGPHGAAIELRANCTMGPGPGGPSGRCGGTARAAIPGVNAAAAPNVSEWMRAGSRP